LVVRGLTDEPLAPLARAALFAATCVRATVFALDLETAAFAAFLVFAMYVSRGAEGALKKLKIIP
jgi:hypothetical protein